MLISDLGVISSGNSTLDSKAGWIVQRNAGGLNSKCTVDRCYSTGDICANEAGGIAGYGAGFGHEDNCCH